MTLWEPGDPAIEDPDAPDDSGTTTTWSVAELGDAIGSGLREVFPAEVWVRGEISSLRAPNRTGHQYFDLVEPGAEPGAFPTAKISVTLFKNARSQVLRTLADADAATALDNGVEVRIRGRVDWWVGGGQLRLVMSAIDPVFTLGQLDAQRRALLARLAAEGLLDANAKVPLPPVPYRIGLVTSAGSAAHADFVNELHASRYAFDVILTDARVQGADAVHTVVAAIAKLVAAGVDVIAVVRGGGSRTDLVAFDHADVAHAIARSPVPVFTGIGHEIDRSIADEVAHSAFKTPTAAAGAVVARVAAAESALDECTTRLATAAGRHLTTAQHALDARLHRVARAAGVADTRATTHLRALQRRLELGADRHLRDQTREWGRRRSRLEHIAPRLLDRATERLDAVGALIDASDPERLLARGWSATRTADGHLLRSTDGIEPGATLVTTLHDGTVTSTVTAIDSEENRP